MEDIVTAIDDYLELFREGDEGGAFFGLLEFDAATLAHLGERFEREQVSDVRVLLLEMIWQRRDPAAFAILGRALEDADGRVWRTAIDGLVALASPEGLAILKNARAAARDQEQVGWLDEAIDQVNAALAATPRTTS